MQVKKGRRNGNWQCAAALSSDDIFLMRGVSNSIPCWTSATELAGQSRILSDGHASDHPRDWDPYTFQPKGLCGTADARRVQVKPNPHIMKTSRLCALACALLLAASSEAATHYVNLNNPSSVSPYTNWASAAPDIQSAIDVAEPGDLILVSNGVYQTGSHISPDGVTNRIVVRGPFKVRSLYGASATVIVGSQVPGGSLRCAYLADGASLDGFTLTNGAKAGPYYSYTDAGGVHCTSTNVFITNCFFFGNSGATYSGTLDHCTLRGNTSPYATYSSILNYCTITRSSNGASYEGELNNCIIAYNAWGVSGGVQRNCTIVANTNSGTSGYASLTNCIIYNNGSLGGSWQLVNCCVPYSYFFKFNDNFTNEPAFVDFSGGDFRLRPDSPCINGGAGGSSVGDKDFAGNPRVVGTRVDVGAYEFQTPASAISYAYLQSCGLPFDGSADYIDSDGDGMNNSQEWIAGTNPTNRLSVLRMFAPTVNGSDLYVSWQSATNRVYFVERATNLAPPIVFHMIATNIVRGLSSGSTIGIIDRNAASLSPVFYRVGVQ